MPRLLPALLITLLVVTATPAVATQANTPETKASPETFRLTLVPGGMPRVVRSTTLSGVGTARATGVDIPDLPVRALRAPVDADWGWQRSGVEAAWRLATTKGRGVVVAVIDTGIDVDHPGLAGALWVNPGEIAENNLDDDGNGYVDDVHGYNFVEHNGDLTDHYGHGTHVAGIIGASADRAGSRGVAPGASIMAVRVIGDDGRGDLSDVIEGIGYAVEQGARVINLSLGAESNASVLAALQPAFDAARAAGAVVVAAAGNEGPNDPNAGFPAGITGVIGVGSIDDDRAGSGPISYFSSAHAAVDLVAPGYGVLSTIPGGFYFYDSGTSMAAPHVAGVAALLMGQRRRITPSAVESILGGSAERYPLVEIGGRDAIGEQIGDGVLDAAAAVAANAANAGGVVLSDRLLRPGETIRIAPFHPSGRAARRCALSLRLPVHPGRPESPIAERLTLANRCQVVELRHDELAARLRALSGVGEEYADLELVVRIDGARSVRRLLVELPDTAAPVIAAGFPAVGSAGILTGPQVPVALAVAAPEAIRSYELRMRPTATSEWIELSSVAGDETPSYAHRPLTAGDLALSLLPGEVAEISARATDAAGNVGDWSAPTRVIAPTMVDLLPGADSIGFTPTVREGMLGESLLSGREGDDGTPPRLSVGPFRGNLFAFTGTYSAAAPVCYRVTAFYRVRGVRRATERFRCTAADWSGAAHRHDATRRAYAEGETGVLLFAWSLPLRSYRRVTIEPIVIPEGAVFEIDAIATTRP